MCQRWKGRERERSGRKKNRVEKTKVRQRKDGSEKEKTRIIGKRGRESEVRKGFPDNIGKE